ncbi:MAG: DUF4129 domain-containing protein [Chloroflexi bacterium]|nr:DUF4129 domain-containing protein [Chloroflexota bacterium]
MEKHPKNRLVILAAALFALIALVVLGSALKNVSFRPAQRLSRSETEVAQISVNEVVESIADVPLWKQVVFWVLLFFFILLVSALLSPEMRKRLLLGILRLAISVILFLYIMKNNPGLLEGLFAMASFGAGPADPAGQENIPPPVFEPPHISGWLSFFVTLGIVVLTGWTIWRMNRWWVHRNELLARRRPLDELAEITRTSLQELSEGGSSYQDTIIQCYERMSRAVSVRRGLSRDMAMTPSEFAARLEKAGLPRGPVDQLTRLFESVRYGARISEQREVDQAVSCLTSILKYCGEAA